MLGRRWRLAMIGLDTNIVVRWLVGDDRTQIEQARAAIDDVPDDLFLNVVVLVEAAWVMAGRYRADRRTIAAGLRSLLAHPRSVVLERAAIEDALTAYETGGPGLSDHLIGALNKAAGCRTTLTFDRRAGRGPHFTAIA